MNGEVSEVFQAQKGIRHGDPISPYLFVICMEYLNRCLLELKQQKEFHFHPRCKRLGLVNVCFADDLLLFARGDVSSVQALMHVLDKFATTSGLKANQLKSCIYFGGVSAEVKKRILEVSGMTEG